MNKRHTNRKIENRNKPEMEPIPLSLVHSPDTSGDSDDENDDYFDGVILYVYVDIAVATKKYVDYMIMHKVTIPPSFLSQLGRTIDEVTIIYHKYDNEDGNLKYEFGVVLRDLKIQLFRIEQYMFKFERLNSNKEAKIEAYQDPDVAAYAELTKTGLKTRNKFYQR